jgi:hypothetical protein
MVAHASEPEAHDKEEQQIDMHVKDEYARQSTMRSFFTSIKVSTE